MTVPQSHKAWNEGPLQGACCADISSATSARLCGHTFALLHDQVDVVGVLDDLVERHNVGVR